VENKNPILPSLSSGYIQRLTQNITPTMSRAFLKTCLLGFSKVFFDILAVFYKKSIFPEKNI
jgi:hypothetical protein